MSQNNKTSYEAQRKGFKIYNSAPINRKAVVVGVRENDRVRIYARYWNENEKKWDYAPIDVSEIPVVIELLNSTYRDWIKMRKVGVV